MKNERTCTCIVPFYNEAPRVGKVVRTLLRCKHLQTIICVDDCSTDLGATKIPKNSRVIVISLQKNHGKSGAVLAGLHKVKSSEVFLCDADLINLDPQEVDNTIAKFRSSGSDMIIMRRTLGPKLFKTVRSDIIISGERVLRTKDLRSIYRMHTLEHWDLEPAINEYMYAHQKHTRWIHSSAINTMKIEKSGWIRGSILMIHEVLAETFTRFNYAKHMLFFCHDEIV